ncbi:MAG: hypothetical protein QME75_11690 [Deltaproteobacteria bacterium]|nr:hypothetical protein [Deltaproteobacteria bacterium]
MKKLLVLTLAVMLVAPLAWAAPPDDSSPLGWFRGKKTGWQGESMPPGQLKKQLPEFAPQMARAEFYLLPHEGSDDPNGTFVFDAGGKLEFYKNNGCFYFDFKAANVGDSTRLNVTDDGEYALVFVPDLSQYPPEDTTPSDNHTILVLGLTKVKQLKIGKIRSSFQVVAGCCPNITYPYPTQVDGSIPFHLQGTFFLVTTESLEALVGGLDYTPGEAACGVFNGVNRIALTTVLYPTLQVRGIIKEDE